MSSSFSESKLELSPNKGWQSIRLGDSLAEVKAVLEQQGIAFDDSYDKFCLEIDDPYCSLQFVGPSAPRLAQILMSDERAQVNGLPVVNVSLDEALVALEVRSFDDTLWSFVDIDSEYQQGQPITDSSRPTSAKPLELLDTGTLWIKSLGVGLCMGVGQVDAIALRRTADTPRIGCGPLDPQTITTAGSSTIEREIVEQDQVARKKPWLSNLAKRRIQSVLVTIAAIVLAMTAPFLLYRRYQGWKNPVRVVGKVVDIQRDGPFVEHLMVEYAISDQAKRQTKVLPQFSGATELGQEVELCYLPENPDHAVTLQESSSEFLSGYLPYGLVAGPFLSAMLLLFGRPLREP